MTERRSGRIDRRAKDKIYSLCEKHKNAHWVGIDQAQPSVTFILAPKVCPICEHAARLPASEHP